MPGGGMLWTDGDYGDDYLAAATYVFAGREWVRTRTALGEGAATGPEVQPGGGVATRSCS